MQRKSRTSETEKVTHTHTFIRVGRANLRGGAKQRGKTNTLSRKHGICAEYAYIHELVRRT